MGKSLCSLNAIEEYYNELNDFQIEFEKFYREFLVCTKNIIKGIEEKYVFYVKLKDQTSQYIHTAQELKARSENNIASLSAAKSNIKSDSEDEKEQKAAANEIAGITAEINKENTNIARYSTVLNSLYEKKADLGHKADYLSSDLAEMKKTVEECEQLFAKIKLDTDRALESLTRVMRTLNTYISLKIE